MGHLGHHHRSGGKRGRRGLGKAPEEFFATRHEPAKPARQRYVLEVMVKRGFLNGKVSIGELFMLTQVRQHIYK